jgi:hypothetical protein
VRGGGALSSGGGSAHAAEVGRGESGRAGVAVRCQDFAGGQGRIGRWVREMLLILPLFN